MRLTWRGDGEVEEVWRRARRDIGEDFFEAWRAAGGREIEEHIMRGGDLGDGTVEDDIDGAVGVVNEPYRESSELSVLQLTDEAAGELFQTHHDSSAAVAAGEETHHDSSAARATGEETHQHHDSAAGAAGEETDSDDHDAHGGRATEDGELNS